MDAVAHFVDAARRYRAVIDEAETLPVPIFARAARNALAQAYVGASMLPRGDPEAADPPSLARDAVAWEALFQRLDAYLGDASVYHAVFDATDVQDDDPVAVDLADDLADVYFDLGDAITLLDAPGPSPAALWKVGFTFEIHWGPHAVDALRPLHRLTRPA